MVNLIIPSAKIVSEELQKIGKLPAIIYPVSKGIVFDYLLEQYKNISTNFTVICYEKSETVRSRLAAYSNIDINIIDLKQLGDLGHTIYEGLKVNNMDDYIIINFADTIVSDNIFEIAGDCYYYSEDYQSETWTFFEEENGVIQKIYDKKSNVEDLEKRKLFVGVFKITDVKYFKRCLQVSFNFDSDMDSFYYALSLYSKTNPMKGIKTNNWFDIGHAQKYYKSKLEVEAREFNHIVIDKDRGILRKTSNNIDKFIGEVFWYLKLPSDIEYVRPRIFSYSTSYNAPFVEMEYYSYHTVHELFLYSDLTYNQWVDIFSRIKFIFNDFKKYKIEDKSIRTALEDIYLNKTIKRLDKLIQDNRFKPFFENPFKINGVEYKPLNEICNVLKVLIPELLYDVSMFNIIHGDLCFANILIDNNFSFVKLIDPRGKFGKFDIYGDTRYELAKLFHSIDGKYDFIIKDLFTLDASVENKSIDFKILDYKRDFDLFECFLSCFKDEIGADKKKIELIEALLFMSMIPLHSESINHQYVMLATGIQLLDRVADIRANTLVGLTRESNL